MFSLSTKAAVVGQAIVTVDKVTGEYTPDHRKRPHVLPG